MADLAERITAAIEHVERETKALNGPPFMVEVDHCTCYGGNTVYGHEPGCGAEPGPAWWVIETLHRSTAADRRVLERHHVSSFIRYDTVCGWCLEGDTSHSPWPCDDIRDLADRWGVALDDQDGPRST